MLLETTGGGQGQPASEDRNVPVTHVVACVCVYHDSKCWLSNLAKSAPLYDLYIPCNQLSILFELLAWYKQLVQLMLQLLLLGHIILECLDSSPRRRRELN